MMPTPKATRRPFQFRLVSLLALLAALGCVFGLLRLLPRRGVVLTVVNADATPLRGVAARVTGKRYVIGTVGAGGSRTATLSPTGESTIVLSYVDSDGSVRDHDLDVYLEARSAGTVRVEFRAGRCRIQHDVFYAWP